MREMWHACTARVLRQATRTTSPSSRCETGLNARSILLGLTQIPSVSVQKCAWPAYAAPAIHGWT